MMVLFQALLTGSLPLLAADVPVSQEVHISQIEALHSDRAPAVKLAQASPPGEKKRTPSEFVLRNPDLFTDDKKLKPWPKTGSEEWTRQQELDRKREEELKKSIMICKDC